MPELVVSRRSYLMARPSERIMRAAGRAASSAGYKSLARRQAKKKFAELTGQPSGNIVITGHRR